MHSSQVLISVISINDIGHLLGQRTIAEFVENEAILARLHEIGIDYGQGYHFSHPVPLEKLLAMSVSRPAAVDSRQD